jgi:hypothetical protein
MRNAQPSGSVSASWLPEVQLQQKKTSVIPSVIPLAGTTAVWFMWI